MPGSTGPDRNTYTIPEVQLGDTFNFWRDATNTAIYKLNKLKIYDALGSGSIGVTYGSTGAWSASLAPTITEGLTFTQTIVFSSGITAAGVYSSRGLTAIAGIWTTGGLSADRVYVSGGSTFASIVAFVSGLSASTVYASSGSTFASGVWVGGGLTATNIYGSGGSTFAGVFYVGGGATFASTTDHTGAARFSGGLSASNIYGSGGSTFAGIFTVSGGATFASTVDVSGTARFSGGLSASNIYGSGGSTFASAVAVIGGLSASTIYGSGGSTFAGNLTVSGGATFASTTDYSGAARFNGGATASTLQVTGNATVGNNGTGATLGVCGSVSLLARTPLRFADSDSTHYVAFQAPASVGTSITWTLPDADGSAGQVLSTAGSAGGRVLSWKDADGVTGSTKQVQYNQGGSPGATAGFVFEFANATGVCAGTLGLSGGLYCNNNVAIGLTQGAVSSRIYGTNSTAKLEVRGDIRIPSNGFFVTKGMTLPTATETIIAGDENAFIAGRLSIPSGATLTIQTDGSVVIL